MTLLNALLWLFGFQLAGEFICRALGLPLPGAVLGMLLLFLAFSVRKTIPDHLKQTAPALLSHLSLLFIPASVGVMVWAGMLAHYALALLLVVIASTVMTWLASAFMLHALQRRHAARSHS
jgi:holin-like protein